MRLILTLTAILLTSVSFGYCDLKVTSITTCDINGNAYTPKLGEHAYGLRVNWNVSGFALKDYIVRFEMADQRFDWVSVGAKGPGNYFAYRMMPMPLDGPFPCRVTLDPTNVSGETNKTNSTMLGQIVPALPYATTEYFDYQFVYGWQRLKLTKSGTGTFSKVDVVMGRPTVGTSQGNVTAGGIPGGSQVSAPPFNDPTHFIRFLNPTWTTMSVEQYFSVRASNFRMNSTKMNQTWSQYSNPPTDVKPYGQAESRIQSTNAAITAFVLRHLPSNYKSTMSPILVARKLYLAVAQDLALSTTPSLGAVETLAAGKGDSMGLGMVYVAALRNVGIPSRVVSGMTLGTNKFKAWTEFWLPTTGWVPQDPSLCETMSPTGSYPFGFACLIDLNQRTAVSRATAHIVDTVEFGPLWKGEAKSWRTSGTATFSGVSSCTLSY